MLDDADFRAEVKERSLIISPLSGEQLETNINDLMQTSPEKIAAARIIYKELLANIKN